MQNQEPWTEKAEQQPCAEMLPGLRCVGRSGFSCTVRTFNFSGAADADKPSNPGPLHGNGMCADTCRKGRPRGCSPRLGAGRTDSSVSYPISV